MEVLGLPISFELVVGVRERPSPSTAVSVYYLPNVAAAYGAGRPSYVCGAALVWELMPA